MASQSAQQLAGCRMEASAATTAADTARSEANSLRAELREQRAATAQVRKCIPSSGDPYIRFWTVDNPLHLDVPQAEAELNKAQLALHLQADQAAAARAASDAARERHSERISR